MALLIVEKGAGAEHETMAEVVAGERCEREVAVLKVRCQRVYVALKVHEWLVKVALMLELQVHGYLGEEEPMAEGEGAVLSPMVSSQ